MSSSLTWTGQEEMQRQRGKGRQPIDASKSNFWLTVNSSYLDRSFPSSVFVDVFNFLQWGKLIFG